ncbi:MAG: hypothetical protein E7389_07500 [Ruminococcaceae bacterium]|nr:hypothetical protein [Oscillospiraceae bacterium]
MKKPDEGKRPGLTAKFSEIFKPVKSHLSQISVCLIFCIVIFFSYNNMIKNNSDYSSFSEEYSEDEKTETTNKITVYVTGEVVNPGLYELDENSRAADAIELAGGMTESADPEGVNIAKILNDGDQVKVPALKVSAAKSATKSSSSAKSATKSSSSAKSSASKSSAAPSQNQTAPSLVNLNSGDTAAYMTVKGITPEIAANMLAHYNEYGGFESVDELQFVKGIDLALYNKIKDYFTV